MDDEQALPYNTQVKDDWLLKADNQTVQKKLFFLFAEISHLTLRKGEMDSVLTMEHGQMLSSAQINPESPENT